MTRRPAGRPNSDPGRDRNYEQSRGRGYDRSGRRDYDQNRSRDYDQRSSRGYDQGGDPDRDPDYEYDFEADDWEDYFPEDDDPGDDPDEDYREDKRRIPPILIHLSIIALILVILALAAWRLLLWNRGTVSDIDPDAQTTRYDIEVNDMMIKLTDSKLAGHPDDGELTILCLGGNPFSDERGDAGLAAKIGSLGKATVINGAFPDSQITCRNPKYDPSDQEGMDDIFNFFYVAYCINIGNFDAMDNVAAFHTGDERYSAAIEALKSTDFNKVDMIALMYDSTDYINEMPIVNEGYRDELTTYVGSLKNGLELIQEAYPHIRIIFMSPTYSELSGGKSGRTTDLGNGTLIQYWQWAFDITGSCSVSFLDNYYGSINENNFGEYLTKDMHINEKGREKIADHFVYKAILDNYAEYDASSMAVK